MSVRQFADSARERERADRADVRGLDFWRLAQKCIGLPGANGWERRGVRTTWGSRCFFTPVHGTGMLYNHSFVDNEERSDSTVLLRWAALVKQWYWIADDVSLDAI